MRHLYHSARWRATRLTVLAEHPLCVACEREGRLTLATDVDHIVPHGSDLELFWNPLNLQALCAACHARKTRAEAHA